MSDDNEIERPGLNDKNFTIVINGREYTVDTDTVSFDYVVDKAYPDGGRGELISYTILYYDGGGRETEGGLSEGDEVKVKDGTVFNVTRTDRS